MSQAGAWMAASLTAQLGRRVLATNDLERALLTVVETAPGIASTDAASITLRTDGRYRTAVSTDPDIEKADRLQYDLDEGPCVDATADQQHYALSDVRRDPRWPVWGPRAAELGVGSLLAVHITVTHKVVGALNLYGRDPRDFDANDIYVGYMLTEQIGAALTAVTKIETLGVGMAARTVIGQAQGILMAQYDLDADRAWNALVRISQDTNTKLRDLATEVIRTRRIPTGNRSPSQHDPERQATQKPGEQPDPYG